MIRNVAVGVSGGVDSAVAAWRLKQRGLNVIGVFMKNWDETDEYGECTVSQDRADAKFICESIGIPFHEVNFVKNYWSDVFSYFIREYENGFTPNPDIMCNRHIKFNSFIRHCIEQLGVDAVATGHYARSSYGAFLEDIDTSKPVKLLMARDKFKDQTFFLSQVPQICLQNVMFPVGNILKREVKDLAKKQNLDRISVKKESTGICFIGKRNFQDFINEYIPPKIGPIIDLTTGLNIGEHDGLHLWTIGQCCRISGFRKRLFIVAKNFENNVIYVAPGTDHPSLFTRLLYTSIPHWICKNPLPKIGPMFCKFRFQHTKPLVDCAVFATPDGLLIALENPLKAITPGQFAVLYNGVECLGSAKIVRPGPSLYLLQENVPPNYREYHHTNLQNV